MIWNTPDYRIWSAFLRMSSTIVGENLDFDDLKCPRGKNLIDFSQIIFTMFEQNWFWCIEMPQNVEDLNRISQNIFTMVEENFGFWWPEMPMNKGFEVFLDLVNFFLRKLNDFAISYHFFFELARRKPRSKI